MGKSVWETGEGSPEEVASQLCCEEMRGIQTRGTDGGGEGGILGSGINKGNSMETGCPTGPLSPALLIRKSGTLDTSSIASANAKKW